jgi:hypothetical protein
MEKEQVLESRHSSSGSEITNLGLADYKDSFYFFGMLGEWSVGTVYRGQIKSDWGGADRSDYTLYSLYVALLSG